MQTCCDCAENMIANMLTENTGVHMMDSGGGGGRMWQQHERAKGDQTATDYLSSEPFVQLDRDGLLTISTYHHLTDTLEVTETSRKLDAEFQAFMEGSNDSYLNDMEGWVQSLIDSERVDKRDAYWAELTYNECAPISQDFQHLGFEYDGEYYHIVHTHNGADIRGGYSTPHVFHATGELWDLGNPGEGVSLYCPNDDCKDDYGDRHYWDLRHDGEFEDGNGDVLPPAENIQTPEGERLPCPHCGTALKVDINRY